VLVTWLVAERSAISYAVGEWARVWPLSALIRSMGAYFIRRGSHDALYRKVLARYVQMARDEGMTQAIFLEGGLSLNGQVGTARLGLLSYIVEDFDPAGRDVVFVPVGLAYDRVLEDRVLVEAAASGTRRFRNRPIRVAWHAARFLCARLLGRTRGFGTAAAGFGPPLSLRDHLAAGGTVKALGARLMGAISAVVPVLPVPLVARALGEGAATREALVARVAADIARLQAAGAVLRLPSEAAAVVEEGLAPLIRRGLVTGDLQPVARHRALLAFYAASVPQAEQATPSREFSP
jgi:glycerol-3-phosphate O-acyltransferase